MKSMHLWVCVCNPPRVTHTDPRITDRESHIGQFPTLGVSDAAHLDKDKRVGAGTLIQRLADSGTFQAGIFHKGSYPHSLNVSISRSLTDLTSARSTYSEHSTLAIRLLAKRKVARLGLI